MANVQRHKSIAFDGMVIEPGDLIVGDGDGVLCIPFDDVEEVYQAAAAKKKRVGSRAVIGPQVADHMTPDIRSVHADATLQEAGRLMQQWKIGSLLVADDRYYVGFITDTDLARDVVARKVDPATTPVKACMRKPPVTIEGKQPIIEAVRLMKEKATRHLAVTQDGTIVGVLSVSNILRYYSGVA